MIATKKWVKEQIKEEGFHTRGHINASMFEDRAAFNAKLNALADYLGLEIVTLPGKVVETAPQLIVRKKKAGRP